MKLSGFINFLGITAIFISVIAFCFFLFSDGEKGSAILACLFVFFNGFIALGVGSILEKVLLAENRKSL
ncbi:hypothetical protein [Sutcliffiella rhizosphaerae]|uniref:Uncharacterized protein n=1 Tax=Sutcliffiella rhizosphaerae TaxID=2880967 RepID=A0ABN8AH79_9BACI|nr:hypothetical protein [Sutcliffiella rhizosphaerae]CAG9623644.1 hypothetical protein BACCIP111883_04462 [Sutcliffiella rhizosphaerae]